MAYKQKNIFHNVGGWKSEIRMPVWSGFDESPFLGCSQLTTYPHVVERGS